jgi:hypothetical protein
VCLSTPLAPHRDRGVRSLSRCTRSVLENKNLLSNPVISLPQLQIIQTPLSHRSIVFPIPVALQDL